MESTHKSSSYVQAEAEKEMFKKIKAALDVDLKPNTTILLANDGETYIQPDFYSEDPWIVGEIFAHIGKPKKAQDNKIANDILKMLLLEKVTGRTFRKILVVCDQKQKEKLKGRSALALSIEAFGIEIMDVDLDNNTRKNILQAQKQQRMINAE